MGETTTLERDTPIVYPSATFEESVVDTSPEIEVTKVQIENTRAEMSETINAIKEQLSPKRLVEEAKEAASDAISEKVTEVKDAVLEKVSDFAHGAGEIAHNVVASVSGAAHSLSDKVSELTDTAKEKIGDLTHSSENLSSSPTVVSAQRKAIKVVGNASDVVKETGDILMSTIKENPIPTALVGVGLGWLLVDAAIKQQKRNENSLVVGNGYITGNGYASNNLVTPPSSNGVKTAIDQAGQKLSETSEKIGDVVDEAKAKVANTAQDLQAKASDTVADIKDKASDIAHTVQDKASETTALVQTKATEFGQATQLNTRKAIHVTQDFVTENPIAAGAIALLVGAIIGLSLPSTEKENQVMGTYRDQLADQAGQTAQDLLGKVQHVAGDAIDVAKSQLADVKTAVTDSVQSSVKSNGLVPA